jgi:prophage regulatory protein
MQEKANMGVQGKTPLMILRRKQVEDRTGLSRSTIYLRMAEGVFPKPVNLGGRAVGWLDHEIEDWLSSKVKDSRPGQV